jgi:hypothetical protein
MRLIDIDTRLMQESISNNVPKYAILSHTWEEEKVTYSHYVKGGYEQTKGYSKGRGSLVLSYVWLDTCCIDKSSSAELSEAIDSMFRRYRNAKVCFAYLSDLYRGRSGPQVCLFIAGK